MDGTAPVDFGVGRISGVGHALDGLATLFVCASACVRQCGVALRAEQAKRDTSVAASNGGIPVRAELGVPGGIEALHDGDIQRLLAANEPLNAVSSLHRSLVEVIVGVPQRLNGRIRNNPGTGSSAYVGAECGVTKKRHQRASQRVTVICGNQQSSLAVPDDLGVSAYRSSYDRQASRACLQQRYRQSFGS